MGRGTLAAAERLDMVAEVAEAMNTKALVLQDPRPVHRSDDNAARGPVAGRAAQPTQAELRAYNNLSFLLATADPRTALDVAQVGSSAGEGGRESVGDAPRLNGATAALRVGDWATAQGLMDTWLEASSDWARRSSWVGGRVMAACRAAPEASLRQEFDSSAAGSSDPQVAALGADHARVGRAVRGTDADSITDAMAGAEHATGYAVMAYPLAMRAAVWSGNASRAAAAISAFDALSIHGAAVEATRHGMRSGMAALEGRTQDAVDHAVEALERWWNLGARFEYALAVIDASVAGGASQPWLGPHAATARGILEELGARALIDRWDRWPRSRRCGPGGTRVGPAP